MHQNATLQKTPAAFADLSRSPSTTYSFGDGEDVASDHRRLIYAEIRRNLMFVVAVTIFVKPENRQSFIDATLDNARNTRREPGNVRFDVLNAEDDPNRFLLYEAYREKDDFSKHQQTEHYLRWKQAVTDWMAQPRQGVKHTAIFFGDE